jgi:Taurine catabolism dioxygenase TauD, TfdA family
MVSKRRNLLYHNGIPRTPSFHDIIARWSSWEHELTEISISFEPAPSDYAVLQMRTIPPVGGDIIWARAYDIYDRLGPKYARFLKSLTGHFEAPGFQKAADENGFTLYTGPRGSPKNAEKVLQAGHPLCAHESRYWLESCVCRHRGQYSGTH